MQEYCFRFTGIQQKIRWKDLLFHTHRVAGQDPGDHRGRLPEPDPRQPVTWIVKPSDLVPAIITGDTPGIAVRITTNPVAAAICSAVGMPIVSTSANVAGRPVARTAFVLRRQFGHLVDYVVPGECGPAAGPSEIRDLETGQVLRPGTS